MVSNHVDRNKIRLKIERDAHPALLSFKGGATASQVERKIYDLFELSYQDHYHLAGVENMHQILMEHPEIRQRPDGKFEVIANKNNEHLVELVSKQKDNTGKRSNTSFGHFHKNIYSRFTPGRTNSRRPVTSMGRNHHKNKSYECSSARLSTTLPYLPPSFVPEKTPTNTKKNIFESFPSQRPLVHPTTTSSTLRNDHSHANKSSIIEVPFGGLEKKDPKSSSSCEEMPTIKQFSENVKRMVRNIYPGRIPISELSERYHQEYNAVVDPSKLFSKTWIMLSRTTFKEWCHIDDGNISFKNSLSNTSKNENTNLHVKSELKNKENIFNKTFTCSNIPSTVSIPEDRSKTRVEMSSSQKSSVPTGEKSSSETNQFIKILIDGKMPSMSNKNTSLTGPFIEIERSDNSEDFHYDSNAIMHIKNTMSHESLRRHISTALNDFPYLKRNWNPRSKSCPRTTVSNARYSPPVKLQTEPIQQILIEKPNNTLRCIPPRNSNISSGPLPSTSTPFSSRSDAVYDEKILNERGEQVSARKLLLPPMSKGPKAQLQASRLQKYTTCSTPLTKLSP